MSSRLRAALVAVAVGWVSAAAADSLHPALLEMPAGQWTMVHEQSHGDKVRFQRQLHGGSALDTKRRRIVLFGSDTHGEDWSNSPLFFDLKTLTWSRLYESDHPSTYRVNKFGVPVAGVAGEHPWAMHTFGAVTYHEAADTLVVSSYPEHLQPGRFTDAMVSVWPSIRRHPTWLLDLATGQWTALATGAEHFFPYTTAYDQRRGVIIGYKAAGVFEFASRVVGWRPILGPGLLWYHNNAVFDTRHDALIVFGSHENSNDVVVYEPAKRAQRRMSTPGLRPPKSQHRPMAFHAGVGQTVVLFDHVAGTNEWADTWLYDFGADSWTQLAAVTLPFRVFMNYNLVYDSADMLLLLVTGGFNQRTAVWALRL